MPEYNKAHVAALASGLLAAWEAGRKLIEEATPTSVDDTPPQGASEEPWELAEILYREWCQRVTGGSTWANLSNAEKKRWLRIADKALDYMR